MFQNCLMTVTHFLLILCFVFSALCFAQAQELNVPTRQYVPRTMKAYWITHPGVVAGESAVVLFRKTLDLPKKPEKLIVNVSADNKYVLYVNGQQVCFGPQLSDIRHWRYETIDLAPFLRAGRNLIVAEVVNFGPDRFFGMQSVRTAFLLNHIDAPANPTQSLNTNTGWQSLRNRGIRHKGIKWRVRPEEKEIIGGFYAANPTDSLTASLYPWGWQTGNDSGEWTPATFCESASAYAGGFAWLLEPRNTPLQTQRVERIAQLAKVTAVRRVGNPVDGGFLQGKPVTIPANSQVTLLLDNRVLTIGYPELHWSGGRESLIKIGYAENLFLPNTPRKPNRNEIENRRFLGIKDIIVPDGGKDRVFRPTWLRTFRFMQLEITTGAEPLVLQDLFNRYTSTPIQTTARFAADKPEYAGIFELCRRTVQLCTQDYFLSDAYYETMQYLGDSKVHNTTWLALTGNDLHVRNALEQFNHSRLWDGNLTSCYPLRATFVHPNYSVIWVDMLWDYLLWSGNKDFVRQFVPGIQHTLAMFDALIQPNGIAGPTNWAYFVDWYSDSKGGLAPGQDGSNSAVVTLQYVYALQNAARLFDALDEAEKAKAHRQRADQIKQQVYELCYDPKPKGLTGGLMAERPAKDYFDQHTNIMAVLTDALPTSQQKAVIEKILQEPGIGQATYYFRYYLFEAIQKTGTEHLIGPALLPWKNLVVDGLSTTPERYESDEHPSRSECHPWSTAPASAFFSVIAGIRPIEPGFRKLTISPALGELNHIEGTFPHPAGELTFDLTRKDSGGIRGTVMLPAGVSGSFRWKGKQVVLRSGEQRISL
jgi:alpha-L-rhamnosidase